MSSYERTEWKNSPETEITAERLNDMEEGIEQAHKGESTPEFNSYDSAEEYEGTYVIESIKSGEKLKEILTKLTKFTNNIRWMLDFMAPKKIQEVGYTSIADAVEPKIFKASATRKSTFTHNEEYGLTIVKLVPSSISEGNHGLALTDDGQIEVVEDIKYIRVYAAANVSSSGCYFAVLYNEGYSYTPLIPLASNNVGGYEATYSYFLSVKKGDKIGIGIGKSTVIETTLSFATMIIEVIK